MNAYLPRNTQDNMTQHKATQSSLLEHKSTRPCVFHPKENISRDLLFLLLPNPQTNSPTYSLPPTILPTTPHALDAPSNTLARALHAPHRRIAIAAQRARARVVLAAPLSAVHAFLGHGVAQRLREPALAQLPAHLLVDRVLGAAERARGREFGLVEVLWGALVLGLKGERGEDGGEGEGTKSMNTDMGMGIRETCRWSAGGWRGRGYSGLGQWLDRADSSNATYASSSSWLCCPW